MTIIPYCLLAKGEGVYYGMLKENSIMIFYLLILQIKDTVTQVLLTP